MSSAQSLVIVIRADVGWLTEHLCQHKSIAEFGEGFHPGFEWERIHLHRRLALHVSSAATSRTQFSKAASVRVVNGMVDDSPVRPPHPIAS